jgi:hypothetical protein
MNQNKLLKIKKLKAQLEAIDPYDRHNSYKNWALERKLEGLQKTKKSMVKPIRQFNKSEITADLNGANVEIISEVKYKDKTIIVGGRPLIRKGRPFKCNILLKDSTGKIWLEIYQPQENLTFYPQDKIWISNVESVFDDYWHKNKLILTESSVITRGGQPNEKFIVDGIKIEKMTK